METHHKSNQPFQTCTLRYTSAHFFVDWGGVFTIANFALLYIAKEFNHVNVAMLAEISLALFGYIVTSRNVTLGFKHVLEVPLKRERLWELVAVGEFHSHVLSHADEEHPLTVLRNSVVLGV